MAGKCEENRLSVHKEAESKCFYISPLIFWLSLFLSLFFDSKENQTEWCIFF